MCSVFSLAFGKRWLLATSSRPFVELQVMDNGVGDPAATLVVVGSVVGGRTCFGWWQEWLTQMAVVVPDTVNYQVCQPTEVYWLWKTKDSSVITSWRLPLESLWLFPLGFTHRNVALFIEKNLFFLFLLWQRLPQIIWLIRWSENKHLLNTAR